MSRQSTGDEQVQQYSAPAAACAAALLAFLARSSSAQTAAELARGVDMSKSLVFRVLRELSAHDLVERGEDGRYWLSFGALEIGSAFLSKSQFMRSAQLALREVTRVTGQTTNMGVLRETDVLYVLKNEGPRSVVTISHVGARIPAHCSALGKALLAHMPDRDVRTLLKGRLAALTIRTITSVDELLRELEETRARGYAVEEGESILGRCCIATAVSVPGRREMASMSVSMSAEDFQEQRPEAVARLLAASDRLNREAVARELMDEFEFAGSDPRD